MLILPGMDAQQLTDPKARTIPHSYLRQAMLETVEMINQYSRDVGVVEPSLMK